MFPPETERRDQVTHGGASCSRLPFGVKASIAQGAAGSKVRFIARPPVRLSHADFSGYYLLVILVNAALSAPTTRETQTVKLKGMRIFYRQ